MEHRHVGTSGLRVSLLGLGCNNFGLRIDAEASRAVLHKALDAGITLYDTADVYGNKGGSETVLGECLGPRRKDVVIATKFGSPMDASGARQGASRRYIMSAVEESLKRLRTDWIDLYQLHRPDPATPPEETLRALDDLVHQGKVRYVGVSNYPAWRLVEALWISDVRNLVRYESLQPHYNLVHRAEFERELQPLCLEYGIGVIPYSPLGGGFLTGKYRRDAPLPHSDRAAGIQRRYMNEQGFAAVDKLEEIGSAHGATIAQTAIAWVLANPAVDSAIIGANSVEQLEDTLKGAEISLTAEEKAALDEVTAWQERR